MPRQRGRGGGGRGVATYHTPSIPKSRGRLAPRQIAVVGTPPLLTAARGNGERRSGSLSRKWQEIGAPRGSPPRPHVFTSSPTAASSYPYVLIRTAIRDFHRRVLQTDPSTDRPTDRSTDRPDQHSLPTERGRGRGRERGGWEGRIGRRGGERENGSSGRTEEHDHREQDHEERTRFRVSCGSGHGGHVVADLPALPLARLSHRGGGVINRRLGGGGEGKKPDEERGKEREIYI